MAVPVLHCRLPLAGFSLAYRESGPAHGPVVVFVHGVAESGMIWAPVVNKLEHEFRCLVVDLPGHGHSWQATGNWTMSFFAAVLREWLAVLGVREAIVVGHSMGAQISCILALQLPAIVNRLLLVAPAGIETFSAAEATLLNQFTVQAWQQPAAPEQLRNRFALHFSSAVPELNDFLNDLLAAYSSERFAASARVIPGAVAGMLSEPVVDFLPQVQQPVQVLIGSNDLLVPNRSLHPLQSPVTLLEKAQQLFPIITTQLVEGAGHFLPFEQPQAVAMAVQQAQP